MRGPRSSWVLSVCDDVCTRYKCRGFDISNAGFCSECRNDCWILGWLKFIEMVVFFCIVQIAIIYVSRPTENAKFSFFFSYEFGLGFEWLRNSNFFCIFDLVDVIRCWDSWDVEIVIQKDTDKIHLYSIYRSRLLVTTFYGFVLIVYEKSL